jgi:hypothetical protein
VVLSDVLSFARTQAQTDSNGLTDATGIILANEALSDFHRRLVNGGIDASQVQESYTSGTVTGTYLYPTDMLFLKAIELDYSGVGGQNYRTAEQVDVSNLPNGSFSYLRQYADTETPKFDDRGDWFEIFPTPTIAINNLIRIFYFLKPTAYTSVSDTVAYPENMDVAILGWRIAAMFYYSLNKMSEGDAFNMKYDERVRQYISTLSRGVQQPLQASQPNYYAAGWDL